MYNVNQDIVSINTNYSFIGIRNIGRTNLVDYETGGVELGNSTLPYTYSWKCVSSNGDTLSIYKLEDLVWVLKQTYNIYHEDFSFTFDKNMNIVLAYTYQNICYLYYYNSQINDYYSKNIGTGLLNPRITLDDKRYDILYDSEIVCCYVKDNKLYLRKQLEDYDVEHSLNDNINVNNLFQIGFTNINRLGFKTT